MKIGEANQLKEILMTRARQQTSRILGLSQRATTGTLALAILLVPMVFTAQSAQAQTYTVLHNFTGPDGAYPDAGLTMDKAGKSIRHDLCGRNGTVRGCIRAERLRHRI